MGNFLYWANWALRAIVGAYIFLSVLNDQEWHPQKWHSKRTIWGAIVYLILTIYFVRADIKEGLVQGYTPSVAFFIFLVIAAVIGVVYRLNQKKIDNKVKSIFTKHKNQK